LLVKDLIFLFLLSKEELHIQIALPALYLVWLLLSRWIR
jgi:hypothetical protein